MAKQFFLELESGQKGTEDLRIDAAVKAVVTVVHKGAGINTHRTNKIQHQETFQDRMLIDRLECNTRGERTYVNKSSAADILAILCGGHVVMGV